MIVISDFGIQKLIDYIKFITKNHKKLISKISKHLRRNFLTDIASKEAASNISDIINEEK